MLRSVIVFVWLGGAIASRIVGASNAEVGPTYAMLTKMQGSWKTACHSAGGGAQSGFVIDYLNVSFTQLDIKAHVFSDELCRVSVSQWPARYHYVLGRPLTLASGDAVFELNLTEITDPAEAWNLHPANLIKLESGQLLLGQTPSTDKPATTRLDLLETQTPFVRR